jgi:hypothetical protein
MNMVLLVGVSVGFAVSVLTANNFYSEKAFVSSTHSTEKRVSKTMNKILTRLDRPTQTIR